MGGKREKSQKFTQKIEPRIDIVILLSTTARYMCMATK